MQLARKNNFDTTQEVDGVFLIIILFWESLSQQTKMGSLELFSLVVELL